MLEVSPQRPLEILMTTLNEYLPYGQIISRRRLAVKQFGHQPACGTNEKRAEEPVLDPFKLYLLTQPFFEAVSESRLA